MIEASDLNAMLLFTRIAELGSISAGGRALGIPKATASRRLAELEARVGAPLFRRSTRALSLTDVGQRHFARVQPIIRDAVLAEAELLASHSEPSGIVRISAPMAYGQHVLAPKLLALLGRYPGMRIDLSLDEKRIGLVADGFDIAVRMGLLGDSDLVGRRIGSFSKLPVASHSYLKKNGIPTSVEELAAHRAIVVRPDLDQWILGAKTIRLPWCLSTGSMPLTLDAVLAGLGIALIPDFLVADHLATGALVRVLPDLGPEQTDVTLLHTRGATGSSAIRAVIATLTGR